MIQYRMLLIFMSSLFLVGLIFGCLAVLFMPMEQKTEVMNKVTYLFEDQLPNDWTVNSNLLWNNAQHYVMIGLSIFILSLTVLGTPIILLFVFIKGAILGFTSSFIISQMGSKGILFILYSIIPQNLLIIPTLIFYSASSLAIALFILNNRILKYQGRLRHQLFSYTAISIGMIAILLIASMYESYVAPHLMERAIALLPKSLLLFDLYSLSLL